MGGGDDKKLVGVNAFKVPIEWYETVQRIAKERKTTIGGAIQIVFDMGLPIYEHMMKSERDNIGRQYRKLGISPVSEVKGLGKIKGGSGPS